MLYIENTVEKVIVLKALKSSDLRLFPGFNKIDVEKKEDLSPYLDNAVAKAFLTGYKKQEKKLVKKDPKLSTPENFEHVLSVVKVPPSLKFVNVDDLDFDELKDAKHAKEKNDMLNKSGLMVKKANEKLLAKDEKAAAQNERIDALLSEMESMKKKAKEQGLEL